MSISGEHLCASCAKEFAECKAMQIVWGIDRDPLARGAEADAVLECELYLRVPRAAQAAEGTEA